MATSAEGARQRSREGEEMGNGNAKHEVTLVITTTESHCEGVYEEVYSY